MKKMTRLMALLMALLMVGMMAAASALAAATDTDIPATGTDIEQPTEQPTEEPTATPAPTKKPSTSGSTSYATATPEPEATEAPSLGITPEDFVQQVTDKVGGELPEGAVTETETRTDIVMDTPKEEAGYAGSVLTYHHGEDGGIVLCSTYTAEVLEGFKGWLASLTDVDALNASEAFADFVKNAKVLLGTLLPDLTEEQISELLLAILTSGTEGVELTAEDLNEFFGAGVDGEVLGLYAQDGYEFCLLQTEESILLGVRPAAE
ncbi:MAG: hypothetical protein J1E43_06365 [Christensenellaceae bacterium]|nr:hypothetical protein [Christensenellaceae bacterium]